MIINTVTIDSAILWNDGIAEVAQKLPRLDNFRVICGSGGWPTPCEVGIYLDTEDGRCCIIDWPKPCKPLWFTSDYGDFLVYLDTAIEEEIVAATRVEPDFFRDDRIF